MRMTNLYVERFGAWRDLHLPLPATGLNILYGPNEAGKSTLMRFVRAMLYGFSTTRFGDASTSGQAVSGTIDLEHEGRHFRLHRTHNPQSRGDVSLTSLDNWPVPAGLLDDILNGVEESVFEKVFAIGLREIQELGTLEAGEVSDRIHGLTLGPDGQKLLHSFDQLRHRQSQLLNPSTSTGRLAELMERHDALSAELRQQDKRQRQHRELCRERSRLESNIDSLKQRQSGLQFDLRGCLLMQRIHGPWQRMQDCEQELRDLRLVQDFPDRGVERLAGLDKDLNDALTTRGDLLRQAREAKSHAARLRLPVEVRNHLPSIQGLLDQREWIKEAEQKIANQQLEIEPIQCELDHRLQSLGPSWSLKRLAGFDTSPAAHFRIANVARSFRATLARRAKTQRLIKKLEAQCHAQTELILKGMRDLNVEALDAGLAATRKQLSDLEQLGNLKRQRNELVRRQDGLDAEQDRLEAQGTLPPWVQVVLSFFGLAGISLLAHGINSGLPLNLVVGSVYTLLTVTCAGLCWAIKNYFEQETQRRLKQIDDMTASNLQQIDELERRSAELTAPDLPFIPAPGTTEGATFEADLIKQLTQRIAAIEGLIREEQQLTARRQRLHGLRTRLQQREREVGSARQSWQELMTQLGFQPASSIDEAFETWKLVVEACDWQQRLETLRRDHSQQRWIVDSFDARIREVVQRVQGVVVEPGQARDYLQTWEDQLAAEAARRLERARLKREAQVRLREAGEYFALSQDIKTQRAALLVQGGAAHAEDFLARAADAERRIALLEEQTEARMELDRAIGHDRDLVISEEDLRRFDQTDFTERTAALQQELADIEADLSQAHEALGSLKYEIRQLESDRESTRVRFDREQVAAELQLAAEDWLATELAGQGLTGLRCHFEKTCQPVTLADASRHLQRLTLGKYRNIWTPLGDRELRIDDEQNHTLSVEQLSRGTREQLFLAIRLALVEELARQGTRLPMVLDDVLVNFDQERAEAATEVLRDFSQQGHQVLLFTCHRHLAERAQTQGLQPIWLPAKEGPVIERMAG